MYVIKKYLNQLLLNYSYLVTHRGTFMMETELLHDYFGNFSTQGERYYFHMKGNMQGEVEPT